MAFPRLYLLKVLLACKLRVHVNTSGGVLSGCLYLLPHSHTAFIRPPWDVCLHFAGYLFRMAAWLSAFGWLSPNFLRHFFYGSEDARYYLQKLEQCGEKGIGHYTVEICYIRFSRPGSLRFHKWYICFWRYFDSPEVTLLLLSLFFSRFFATVSSTYVFKLWPLRQWGEAADCKPSCIHDAHEGKRRVLR